MLLAIETSHAVKLPRTGVEESCYQMIENLKVQIPADWRVVLYSHVLPNDKLKNLPPNWEWKILNWPLRKLWSQWRLGFELLMNPPDLFFAPGQLLPSLLPEKTKVITFVHDSAFEVEKKAYSFWGKIYLELMNRWVVWRSNKIITSTEFNKQELQKYYSVAPEKITVVPLAYDKDIFCTGIAAQPSGISKPYFIYLGRLEAKKNTALLIRAFNQVRQSGFDCQLLLIGKPGYGFQQAENEIKNSPYQQDIIHPGYVSSVDLPKFLRGALALVLPSRYEGFGMPVLEGMACGTPVIASDIPALREVGGEAAEYVIPEVENLAAAMVKVARDSVWREQKRLSGRQQAKKFDWAQTAAKIVQAIANL